MPDACLRRSFFDPGTHGNVSEEFHYGGDTAGVPSVTCPEVHQSPPPPPSGETYRIDHRYQHGVLRRSEYRDGSDSSLGFWIVDRDIDQDTGLVAASRDTAGLETTFTYDRLGRLKSARPEAGQGARTEYEYTAAQGATAAQVSIDQEPNGGGVPLASSIVTFDGQGRVASEFRKLPTGSFNRRSTFYNARGWKTFVSEKELGTPTNFTSFLDYDAFGRPGTIRAPDGREVTLSYTGVSRVERTVSIGGFETEFDSTTTEEFDRQGRLWRVTEPSGEGNADVPTTYGYDEGNRLTSVSTDDGTTVQQRLFDYDGRGFLISEQHPEKGNGGNGTVTYGAYDARGHAGEKTDDTNVLDFVYDRAERLTTILGAGSRLEKEFVYAGSNLSSSEFGLGKLRTATRHNYLSPFGGVDVAISETYTYEGTGGRVSKRLIERADAGGPADPFFEQEFSWTELGHLDTLTYPSCLIAINNGCVGDPGPARTVTHEYDNGFLTAMPGWVSSIEYHPNEMVKSVAHSGGVTQHWDLDPDSMRRPAKIYTTGASADFDTGTYSYDGAGNITAMGTDTFSYDPVSRLVAATLVDGPSERCQTLVESPWRSRLGLVGLACSVGALRVERPQRVR